LAQRLGQGRRKGEFLSLSAKPAEEPKPAASRASFDKPADEEIPF
jgi:hypothetical protein